MTVDSFGGKDLRASILLDSRNLLIALQSGASDELLATTLSHMREQERRLIRHQRTMLHPAMWRILRNRLINRKDKEIIDTLSDINELPPKHDPPTL